jgi:hypothetical protein
MDARSGEGETSLAFCSRASVSLREPYPESVSQTWAFAWARLLKIGDLKGFRPPLPVRKVSRGPLSTRALRRYVTRVSLCPCRSARDPGVNLNPLFA